MPIPRYRNTETAAFFSAGFRPFFLLSAFWATFIIPISILMMSGYIDLPTVFSPYIWHSHELIYGYGCAVVAGFLLTAIPNWTGQLPLQGKPLVIVVCIWATGRIAMLFSYTIGSNLSALIDLSFLALIFLVAAREIIAGNNWRNLPVVLALLVLFFGNVAVHMENADLIRIKDFGIRIGISTLLFLIVIIGGRVIPSFTRNWLTHQGIANNISASIGIYDRYTLLLTVVALIFWSYNPEIRIVPWLNIYAGLANFYRLSKWKGRLTVSEPLLFILHVGYFWLAFGLLFIGMNALLEFIPAESAIHSLNIGAIGTMTLAMMTRVSLGHTGRQLVSGSRTCALYVMITLSACLRIFAPIFGSYYTLIIMLAAITWSAAFGGFVIFYFNPLTKGRLPKGLTSSPI